jgi:hypothetical protein
MKKKVTIIFPNNNMAETFKSAVKPAWSFLDCHTHHLTCELTEADIKMASNFYGRLKTDKD